MHNARRTVKETIDVVSWVTGEPRGRVNQLARKLIDDGLLPKSVGRDIKRVGGDAAALLIFALAHAKRAADASYTAREFGELTARYYDLSEAPSPKDWLAEKILVTIGGKPRITLIDALKSLIELWPGLIFELDLIKGINDGINSADLIITTPETNNGDPLIYRWKFLNEESSSNQYKIYRLDKVGIMFLRVLMMVPHLPNSSNEFKKCFNSAMLDRFWENRDA